MDAILSASTSGISIANSSSIAITTSTASSESRPRSSENFEAAETFEGSTLSKFFTTEMIRDDTSFGFMKVPDAALNDRKRLWFVVVVRKATRHAAVRAMLENILLLAM